MQKIKTVKRKQKQKVLGYKKIKAETKWINPRRKTATRYQQKETHQTEVHEADQPEEEDDSSQDITSDDNKVETEAEGESHLNLKKNYKNVCLSRETDEINGVLGSRQYAMQEIVPRGEILSVLESRCNEWSVFLSMKGNLVPRIK